MIDEAHRQLRDLLGTYVLGQLESDEQETVRDHLSWCPDCQDELAEIEPLVPVLRLVDADRIGEFHHVPPPNAGEFVGTGAASLRCNLNSSVLRDDAVGFRIVDEDGREVLTSSLI